MTNGQMEKPLIRIDSEVTRRVRQHARAHMQTEVCGVLVGKMRQGVIEIEAPIEAFTAAQAGAQVTFTQAAWETIYRVKDKEYPEDRIVGWYHSHPGFGVFLSDYDTFIHRNFFSSPDQVAWVYDPHSDEEGCFGWIDGDIHRIASIHVADNSAEGRQRTNQVAEAVPLATRTPPPVSASLAAASSLNTASESKPCLRELQRPQRIQPAKKPRLVQKGLLFVSSLAAVLQTRLVAILHLARVFITSNVPAGKRLLSMKGVSALSTRHAIENVSPFPFKTQDTEGIEQLRPESGK